MPIHVPGVRDRRGRVGGGKRKVVAVLSLTAMVDLFTVLVVFLLQNYNVTGEIIEIPKGVDLPMARDVKELKPATVVIISKDDVRVNNKVVLDYKSLTSPFPRLEVVPELKEELSKALLKAKSDHESVQNKIRKAFQKVGDDEKKSTEVEPYRKVTISADKEVSVYAVRRIMYTITDTVYNVTKPESGESFEEGIAEINFAVLKDTDSEEI